MCEINPAHTMIFRLEAFTSNSKMTKQEFDHQVMTRVLEFEQMLNKDGKFRFHVHEMEPVEEFDEADCVCGHPYDQHRARHNNDPGECLDPSDDCQCEEWSPKEDEGLNVPQVVMVPR